MAKWPDDAVYDAHADRGIEPRDWIFIGLRYPSCTEQNVPQWQERCKVLVAMLRHRRVMNAVPLWVIQQGDHPTHRKTDVQVGATIREEVDEAENELHV